MSLYDIIMLVVFAGAIWFGFWKGLAWQIASVAAIVASYFVSMQFREPLSRYISAEEPWNRVAAMLILFLGTSLLIWSIYASVSKSLKKMELKGFDRQAGALLGAFKGALLCMIITMFSVSMLGEKAHQAIHNSFSGRYVVRGINQVSAIVPSELKPYVDPHVQKFQQAIGHDLGMPLNEFPQYNQYQTAEQGSQNPNDVPRYSGQWQLPSPPAPNQNNVNGSGYTNQPASPANNGNSPFNWGWGNSQTANSQPAGYQQPAANTQNGYQQNGAPPVNGSVTPNTATGWPDLNFKVNSKDAFDAATKAAADAARQAFERAIKK